MLEKFTQEEFWSLYKKLPLDLKNALFAEDVGITIGKICNRNNLENEINDVMNLVTEVLTGLLPPQKLKDSIQKELKIDKNSSEKLFQEINTLIFFPVKKSLMDIYGMEDKSKNNEENTKEKSDSSYMTEDTYREPIE